MDTAQHRRTTVRTRRRGAVLLALSLTAASGLAAAADAPATPPVLPCNAAPSPAWPATPGKVDLAIWEDGDLQTAWQPPACGHWQSADYSVLMAAVGRLSAPGGSDALLRRMGRVSELAGLRYWSVSREARATLISEAHALTRAQEDAKRADFSTDELKPGRDYFYWQHEPTTSGSAVYAMRVLEHTDDRLLVSVRNASDNRYLGFTMLAAGRAQTLYLFQRLDGDQWGYYQLTRLGHGPFDWLPIGKASYANRAIAMFRWFAGLPEDAVPVWQD